MARSKIQLDSRLEATLKDASLKLTGFKKRAFMALQLKTILMGVLVKQKPIWDGLEKL